MWEQWVHFKGNFGKVKSHFDNKKKISLNLKYCLKEWLFSSIEDLWYSTSRLPAAADNLKLTGLRACFLALSELISSFFLSQRRLDSRPQRLKNGSDNGREAVNSRTDWRFSFFYFPNELRHAANICAVLAAC